MLQTKTFEIRDAGTFIPVMATLMAPGDERDTYLLRRAGFTYQTNAVLLCNLNTGKCSLDPFNWGPARTIGEAHSYIRSHWDNCENGAVIDVESVSYTHLTLPTILRV